MKPKLPRTWVRMFKDRFADKVRRYEKRQTVRPEPKSAKALPKVGDRISCRRWTGKPYRSKTEVLLDGVITRVVPVEIDRGRLEFDGWNTYGGEIGKLNFFAQQDGFKGWTDMTDWFRETHGLPFRGILIEWRQAT